MTNRIAAPDMLVKCLEKGPERYVFIYHDTCEDRRELLRVIGRMASRTDLSFNWYDAEVLCKEIRKEGEK